MPKIDLNRVAQILQRNEVPPATLRQIMEELNHVVQAEADPDKPPPVKKQWAILISDPEGRLPDDTEFAGWVLQLPEQESVASVPERIHRAAYEFNTTKKGRLLPVTTIGETLENVPAKHFKEADLLVKTKTPVLMLRTNNKIPRETSDRDTRRGRVD
jgi:hypothetical protein